MILCPETALLPYTIPQTDKRSFGSTKAAATSAVDNLLNARVHSSLHINVEGHLGPWGSGAWGAPPPEGLLGPLIRAFGVAPRKRKRAPPGWILERLWFQN